MTKDEALKMAIDYLRLCSSLMATKEYSDDFYTNLNNTIDACKEALAQPAQEPVAWYGKDTAFSTVNKIFVFNNKYDANAYGLRKSVSIEPLYTHPTPSWQPNKEFVLLSDDEIDKIYYKTYSSGSADVEFARAIEHALKEKNYAGND